MPMEERRAQNDGPAVGPLRGLKVLELGHFIAGPFCTRLLGDLGADVIKAEPPGQGDPFRGWGIRAGEQTLSWALQSRNKRCITLNLKHGEGQALARRLFRWADVVVENYRPGQLEKWGLGFAVMQEENPRCILARISGYGQSGPYRDKPAFGAIGEALGGLRYLSGHPPEISDLPPVRVGVSLGDEVAALYAVNGILAAVHERDVLGTGRGRCIDVALYEAVFSLLESAISDYSYAGRIRQPTGAALSSAAPSNTYRTADGTWLVLGGNSDLIFARLARLMGQPGLVTDPRFRTNADRVANMAALDRIIGAWMASLPAAELERLLAEAEVPAGRVYTIKDCAEDAHFQARGMLQPVDVPGAGEVLQPGVVPKFDGGGAASGVRWTGPALGAHNAEVYGGILDLSEGEIARLQAAGAI
jgi:crotonobetainyl-CoA:carnitine CoA-transferase CaiB-like acyl-CoA transferase